jgi:hypothetical protein
MAMGAAPAAVSIAVQAVRAVRQAATAFMRRR